MTNTQKPFEISGVSALELCQTYGTPLYVYDTAKMESQYKRLKKAFKGTKNKINYACKALTNINVLRFFNQLGSGLDTVSIQEVELGLKQESTPTKLWKTPTEVPMKKCTEP